MLLDVWAGGSADQAWSAAVAPARVDQNWNAAVMALLRSMGLNIVSPSGSDSRAELLEKQELIIAYNSSYVNIKILQCKAKPLTCEQVRGGDPLEGFWRGGGAGPSSILWVAAAPWWLAGAVLRCPEGRVAAPGE